MELVNLGGTPYYLTRATGEIGAGLSTLIERMELLRHQGKLTPETLRAYYGEKRFEQVAESNAIEGSPLSVGETELAILKGITTTGHDPAYVRDAQTLDRALQELVVLARKKDATGILDVKRIHDLVLGDRPGAGVFRSQEVRISGSPHVPPRTNREILDQMEQWERWSSDHVATPAVLRAAVLHAWLAHIHPFIDGNGRTARAITNLELIRDGYPPIIIRRKDRDQYIDALARADEGELGPFVDLVLVRAEDALRDLERAAKGAQGYDAQRVKVRRANERRLERWTAAMNFLAEQVRTRIEARLEDDGVAVDVRRYDQLTVEDFETLCAGHTVPRSGWAFRVACRGVKQHVDFLAWTGAMGAPLRAYIDARTQPNDPGRPAVMWSIPNPAGYPPWTRVEDGAPGGTQFTLFNERWIVLQHGKVAELSFVEFAEKIAEDVSAAFVPPDVL